MTDAPIALRTSIAERDLAAHDERLLHQLIDEQTRPGPAPFDWHREWECRAVPQPIVHVLPRPTRLRRGEWPR